MSSKGLVKISTVNAIEETILEITAIVGSETFKTELKIEVYDCFADAKFTTDLRLQVTSPPREIDALASKKDVEGCEKFVYVE